LSHKERKEMLNEGIVLNDNKTAIKSEMIRQIRLLGPTDPDTWEWRVFTALTGRTREEIDWNEEDNHAGYYLWITVFDDLIEELIEDGYVRVRELDSGKRRQLVPVETDPDLNVSQIEFPTGS
jgi:hypothetical protein